MRQISKYLISLFVIMPSLIYGQNPNSSIEVAKMEFKAKQVIPPSPDAAELGKYGNVPISLFTGTPNVSIPLYELKGNSLSLPLSLRYNASGFKPEEQAPWVGSGWSLNAGGVITRSVLGNPDNETNYFGVSGVLNPPPYSDVFGQYNYMKNVQTGELETQPDVYYYNFAGHTGKFVLKPDFSVVKKEKDLKIITPSINTTPEYSKFTITDEQGVTYVFDKVETTLMVPNDAEDQSARTYNFVSAWYLSRMYSADDNDEIVFDYYATTNAQVLFQNLLPNKSVSFTYGCKHAAGCGLESVADLNSSIDVPPTVSIKKRFLQKITLKKANTEIAYIDLVSSAGERLDSDFPEDRKLNQVKIYSITNGVNKLIQQFDLNYGYFGSTETGQYAFLKKRLRLDHVQQIAVDGNNTSSPPAHNFTYNETTADRFTPSLDHWGFYNASGNTSLIPYVNFPQSITEYGCSIPAVNIGDGANREPSLEGSSATMLGRIDYPTGGYTTFEYELNEAKFDDGTTHPVGGIRLKQMIDYSFSGKQAMVKNYKYVLDDNATSGTAGRFPDYRTNSNYHHYFTPSESCTDGEDYVMHTISVSSNSIYGLGSFQGSHIGYSQVTESQLDLATNQSLGRTVYKYNTGQYFEHEDDISAGDLIQKSEYRNDGKLLTEETSEFQYSLSYELVAQTVKANELQSNKNEYCRTNTNDYIQYGYWNTIPASCVEFVNIPTELFLSSYSIFQQNKQLVKQTQKVYDQVSDNYLTTVKNFTYGNIAHNYPTLIEQITSNGEKVKTAIKYIADYTGPFSINQDSRAYNINLLQQKNILGLPVEKLQYRESSTGTNRRYISGQITDYLFDKPTHIYFLEAKPPLTSVTTSEISGGEFVNDTHYRMAATLNYDTKLNLKEQFKTDDVVKSYLWDYDDVYPVAEINGASSNQVAYTSFETNNTGGFLCTGTPIPGNGVTGNYCYQLSGNDIGLKNNIIIDPLKSYTVSYWCNGTGPFSVSGSESVKQGKTINSWTYYEHKVSGVSTVTISGTGLIDELRLYLANAQMSTATYSPLIGITSHADASNHIIYYDYDGLSRLTYVKDEDGNMIKSYSYNYGTGGEPDYSTQSLFYNAEVQYDYTKEGCPVGTHPDIVTYKIPYGKYAAVSQPKADQLADNDRFANGQSNANAVGLCRYYNAQIHEKVFKNDCLPLYGPASFVWFTIEEGMFKSTLSQADADNMAETYYESNNQAYANANGVCSCIAENEHYIESQGNCETQTQRIYLFSDYQESGPHAGQWLCTYEYIFSDNHINGPYSSYESTLCPQNQ